MLAALLLAQTEPLARIQQAITQGRLDEARREIDESLKARPRDPALHNLRGIVLAQQGDAGGAEAAFEKALAAAPGSASILVNLARHHQRQGNNVKALRLYHRAVASGGNSAEVRYQIAFLSMKAGECAASLAELRHLSAESRATSQALAIETACGTALGRPSPVADLAAHPKLSAEDVAGILPLLEKHKAHAAARQLLEAVAARSKPDAKLLTSLARQAYELGDFQGALGYLGQARDLGPGDAGVHFFIGLCAVALDLVVEAKNALAEAVRLAPDNAYYRYALGAAIAQSKEVAPAIAHFEEYLRLRPRDPHGRFALAVTRFLNEDFDVARREFQSLTAIHDTAAGSHYFLGRIARREGRLVDAEKSLLAAARLLPTYADVRAELGHVYLRQRNDAAAARQFEWVIARDADHYLANLGQLALFQRNKDPRADAQSARVAEIQEKRAQKEQLLWRTIEFRPYQ